MNASAGDDYFLTGPEVQDLLRMRTRSGLFYMRKRGELIGFQKPNGYWLYPANQPIIQDALRSLAAAERKTRSRRKANR